MKLELDKGIDKGPMTLEQLEAKAEMEEAENARKELEEKLRSEMDNGEGESRQFSVSEKALFLTASSALAVLGNPFC